MNKLANIDTDIEQTRTWLADNGVAEVECLVPDAAGIARGKILSTQHFVNALQSEGLHLAESLYSQDVRGHTVMTSAISELEPDISLQPDLNTLRLIPWTSKTTAAVICDAFKTTGEPLAICPRQVLKRVIHEFRQDGLQASVAPELEFHLTEKHQDPNQAISPPKVRSGAFEAGAQTYAIDPLRDFDALFNDLYHYCNVLGIAAQVLTHEAGRGQFEINIDHADPLKKADEVFMFKRAAREAALKHGKMITFMAKPIADEPGNAMHIHQSITSADNGENIFADRGGNDSHELHYYVGGLQKYIPATLLMIAPYINSYRRFVPNQFAPVNTHWGHENRTVGLRIPHADKNNRRVENRIIGADANPYLAIAATLACGLLGLRNKISPGKEMTGNAYTSKSRNLPEHLLAAIDDMRKNKAITAVFDQRFIALLTQLKYDEYQQFQNTITPWEREHLLYCV
jgi:glutamine synthetase